ncbi:YdeI/OmpD-associated family protein [Dyadobacter sandarakinus]|uniref:YdeI/OmpD-associated family protein n=1 Tax=Dyadobacter sandarakinus TaxID=2747268 RepID=A0ABX7I1J8_9BACT|nr:YdeI/OmpD-associated family protein [Dyadobacter sandarakinus]QRQ99668.1 YdeI/OmpD-associated family protein [Dyadobacter sandarakinus]
MESKDGKEVVIAADAKAWRDWLEEHAATSGPVYLVIYNKNSLVPSVGYAEAVEHALCYGWIDSKTMKRDARSVYQTFTKRKPFSTWARSNKERVLRMTALGLMRPEGQAMIDQAKQNGSWDKLNDIDNEVIPADLQRQFDENEPAYKNFMAFAPSARKLILQWISAARRPETREKRIQATVDQAARNLKAV